jgi:hypothetical protein
MNRRVMIEDFYKIITELKDVLGGTWYIPSFSKKTALPPQGVYFYFEPGELREKSTELRITRIGTHAISNKSKTLLIDRILHDRGTVNGPRIGGGYHRKSVFRRHIGNAIINKNDEVMKYVNWDIKIGVPRESRIDEQIIEKKVSSYIHKMPILWLAVPGNSHKNNMRAFIESNSIALLSNYLKNEKIDSPSKNWLGLENPEKEISNSGLWNIKHTEKKPDPDLIVQLKKLVNNLKKN